MNNSAKRASIILGVFMAVILIGSTFLQLITRSQRASQTTAATSTVAPTFPAPLDASALNYSDYYLHPSGIFAIAQPDGYAPSQPSSQDAVAQINLVNNEALSVIDAFVQKPAEPPTADSLDAFFSPEVLDQTWANFQNWSESSRRREGDDLLIDFAVRFQNQNYVARQRAWTDGEWIYAVRVLAPENATQFLVSVLDSVSDTMTPFKQFDGEPFNWQLFYDPTSSTGIRHPAAWQLTDGGAGRPTSFSGDQGEALRVETIATAIADEAAARSWVESGRPNSTILSVAPGANGGFRVAYAYTTADGDPQSGLAVMLPLDDGRTAIADLRFAGENIDLNAIAAASASEATPEADATAEPGSPDQAYFARLAQIMSSFGLLPPLTLSSDSLPATATPVPTRAFTPTPEATAEATAEATTDATPETTPGA